MARKYELNEAEALLAFEQIKDHCTAIKNWIALSVEVDNFNRAKELTVELRKYEQLYKKLNVKAHKFIDENKS